jgi:signal transduction histidine kinase
VILQFTDTGKGMTPEVMTNIFNPFYTTKPIGEGTGLGLAIAYQIVTEHHRGSIHVQSTPGAGSTFVLRLPKQPVTTPCKR